MVYSQSFRQAIEQKLNADKQLRFEGRRIQYEILGQPHGKGRTRSTPVFDAMGEVARNKNGRAVVRNFTPKKTRQYEKTVRHHTAVHWPGRPSVWPIALHIECVAERPKSWPKWKIELVDDEAIVPVSKPDADNVYKAIADAAESVAYVNDRQIIESQATKRYARPNEETRVIVFIEELPIIPSNIKTKGELEEYRSALESYRASQRKS